MKRIIFSLFLTFALLSSSCGVKLATVVINDAPSSKVMNAAGNTLETNIKDNNKVSAKLQGIQKVESITVASPEAISGSCQSFVVIEDPNTGVSVPVGLDYKYSPMRAAVNWTGLGIGFAGLAVECAGLIPVLISTSTGDEDMLLVGAVTVCGGGALALTGLSTAGFSQIGRSSDIESERQFTYLPTDYPVEVDLHAKPSQPSGPPKIINISKNNTEATITSSLPQNNSTTKNKKVKSSQSSTLSGSSLSDVVNNIEKVNKGKQSEKKATTTVNSVDLFRHTVVAGETLADIAKAYGVSIPAIIKANRDAGTPLNDSKLTPGQKIVIPL